MAEKILTINSKQEPKVVQAEPIFLPGNNKAMVVIAHPDDEAMGLGGTIRWWTASGVEVILTSATYGELGYNEYNFLPSDISRSRLAEIRKEEQLKAAKILGISQVIFLGFGDQGLESNRERLGTRLLGLLEEVQPGVVITWAQNSEFYSHPDHDVIAETTTQALLNSSLNDSADLFYFLPKDPTHISIIPIDSHAFAYKNLALRAHNSQMTPDMLVGPLHLAQMYTVEGCPVETFARFNLQLHI